MTTFSYNSCYCNYDNCICKQYSLLKCIYPSCRCKNKLFSINIVNNHRLCYLPVKTEKRKNNANNYNYDNYRSMRLLKCTYSSGRCKNKLFATSIESDQLLCYLAIETKKKMIIILTIYIIGYVYY